MAYSSGWKASLVTLTAGAAAVKLPATPLANRNLLRLVGVTADGLFWIGDQSSVTDSGATQGIPIPPGQPGSDLMPIGAAVDVYGYAPVGGPNVVVAVWEYSQ